MDINDIIAKVLGGDLTRFLDTAYVAVDGTDQTGVRFRLFTERLDAEILAALQERG